MERLASILQKSSPLSDESLRDLFSIAQLETFRPGAILLRPGTPGRNVYFIESGILQVYMEKANGLSTDYLLVKDDFCIATDSFITGDPTRYCIAALTETRTISTNWDQLEKVMDKHSDLTKCVFTIIEKYRREKDWRESDLPALDAEKRVDWFRKKYPGLIGTITDDIIWTFLKLDQVAYNNAKNGTSQQVKSRVIWNYNIIDLAEMIIGKYEMQTTIVDGLPATQEYLIRHAANHYDNVTEEQLTAAVRGITSRKKPTKFHERIIARLRGREDRLLENKRIRNG